MVNSAARKGAREVMVGVQVPSPPSDADEYSLH